MNHEILYTKAINFLLYKIPLKTIALMTTVLKIFNITMNIYIIPSHTVQVKYIAR